MLNGLDQGYDFSFGGRLMGWKLGVYLCVYIRPLCNEIKDGQKSLLLTLQVLLYTGYFSLHVFSLLNMQICFMCLFKKKKKTIRPVLNLPTDDWGKRGGNKMRVGTVRYFSVYSIVYIVQVLSKELPI